MPGEMLPLDRPGRTSDDALVIYGTTTFSSLGGLAWLGLGPDVPYSGPLPLLPSSITWQRLCPTALPCCFCMVVKSSKVSVRTGGLQKA